MCADSGMPGRRNRTVQRNADNKIGQGRPNARSGHWCKGCVYVYKQPGCEVMEQGCEVGVQDITESLL
eukprot:8011092-Pyramimonas_sp.AAC.1